MPDDEKLFYTIGEVADQVQVKPYVLRYWESEFKKLNPQKSATGQRTYRKRDIQIATIIKRLLYDEKYTIAGAIQKLEELESKEAFDLPKEEPKTASAKPEPEASVSNSVSIEKGKLDHPSSESLVPALDPQKVKELKRLIEASYTILKKYHLA
jgi:DNA-binding transcriptional MerR regulator